MCRGACFDATFPEGGRPWGLGYLEVSPSATLPPPLIFCPLPSPFSLSTTLIPRLSLSLCLADWNL